MCRVALSSPAILAVIPDPGLLFGLMLAAAIVGGFVVRRVHVPRVIGYLLGGVLLRSVLQRMVGEVDGHADFEALQAAAEPLGAINDLALGLILFSIGGVFERSRLKAVGPRVLKIGLLEMLLVTAFVATGCGLLSVLTQPEYGLGQNCVLALLLGVAGIATAPAATLFVLREYEAKGPLTDTVLGLVGFNNIVCIVAFNVLFLVLARLGAIETPGALGQDIWLGLVLCTAGSVGLGLVCGTLLSIVHAKLPLAETSLIFFAIFIVLGAGEKWLLTHVGVSFNFLLTALVIGAVYYNVAIDSQSLDTALRTVAMPIFAGFFVLAGYNLHIADLIHLGWIGAAYVLCRTAGKLLGGRLGVRWAGVGDRIGEQVGATLLCQAAVVIGLATFVQRNWASELAGRFATIVFGSVVVFEMVGPLLVKRAVKQGGEVKAITLLGRGGMATGGSSVFRLTLRSLLRLAGLRRRPKTAAAGEFRVEDIMRRNVQFLRSSANLDEVLRFIEHSTYNHFPVVDDDGECVGVIHFSDVRGVIYDPAFAELITAIDLADEASPMVPMELSARDVLDVFRDQNVGVLPVAEKAGTRHIVGIVEQRDLLRVLQRPAQNSG